MSEIPHIPKAKEAVDLLLQKNVPFVLFRRPGRGQVELFVTLKNRRIMDGSLFVVAPFTAESLPEVEFLQPTDHISTSKEWAHFYHIAREEPQHKSSQHKAQNPTSREEYSNAFTECQEALKDDLQKVVLSRIATEQRPKAPAYKMFESLGDKHPRAFVYLMNFPLFGTWMGATPEILIHAEYGDLRTMALAGTRPAGQNDFSDKEKKEHEFVADFIGETLSSQGLKGVERTPTRAITAGQVSHLRTDFHAPYPDRAPDLMDLAIALHPTPATSGTPKKAARAFIEKVENHDRRLYTGFVGILDNSHCGELYVNLRCAQLFEKEMNLYIGGGITTDSDEQAEWDETEMKSQTLLSVFKNI